MCPIDPYNVPTKRDILHLAWPMALKAIILHGVIVIDGFLVSSLGESALAGMGLAAAIAGFVTVPIFAFSGAMQIRAAQAHGTSDPSLLRSVFLSGLAISLSIALIGILLVTFFGQTIVTNLAENELIATYAWQYLSIFLFVIFGEAIGQVLSSFFNGCGKTKYPLYSYCLSLPVNVGTSLVLINGYLGFPALGVMGAATGSALAVAVQIIFLISRLLQDDPYLKTLSGWLTSSFLSALRSYFIFALPIAVTFSSAGLASHICTMIYAKMSLAAFAAMTLIAPWNMVVGQISMQWTQATGIFVAQLLGRKTPERELDNFLRSAWRGAFITAIIGSVVFVVLCFSASKIYDDLSKETHDVLFSFLPVLIILPFLKSTNAICGNVLRASGDTVYVMHVFLWSQWLFRVPATALTVLYFDVSAFWVFALLLGEEIVKFPAFHTRLFSGGWKQAKVSSYSA